MLTVHLYLIDSQALHSLNKQLPKKWGKRPWGKKNGGKDPLQGMFSAGSELPSHLGGFGDLSSGFEQIPDLDSAQLEW